MSRLKLYAHTRFPARVVSWLEAARRRSYKGNPCTPAAYSRFTQLNESSQPGLIKMRDGIEFYTHTSSFDSFQWFCWRSPSMVQEYDRFVSDSIGKSALLDVGACHGVYTLTFLHVNSSGRAIAMEPSPVARAILEDNIEKNCLRDRTRILSDAAGVDGGKMYALLNWHHLEATRSNKNAVAVATKSIDTVCDEHAFTPDLIKVDVEGFELYALQGARRVLSAGPVVYLEIHPKLTVSLGYDHTKCFDLMSEAGYQITEVDGQQLTRGEFRNRHHTFFTVCRQISLPVK